LLYRQSPLPDARLFEIEAKIIEHDDLAPEAFRLQKNLVW
jgi:hypothetical protein